MTDQEHAKAVAAAAKMLHEAVAAARRAGLYVELQLNAFGIVTADTSRFNPMAMGPPPPVGPPAGHRPFVPQDGPGYGPIAMKGSQ